MTTTSPDPVTPEPAPGDSNTPFIVVGLDDSPSALAALSFAAGYARTTGADLRAVHVISVADQIPVSWSPEYVGPGYLNVGGRYLDDASHRQKIQAVFASVHPEARWRLDFVDGIHGQTLVERSGGAAMLVVGTREHTGLGRILSGSISHYCLSHAPCPVVAVPAGGPGSP